MSREIRFDRGEICRVFSALGSFLKSEIPMTRFHALPSQAIPMGALIALFLQVTPVSLCRAQDVAVALETSVAVEGRVANLYESGSESLVQVLVQKSELGRIDQAGYAPYPAPGQYVYIHVRPDDTLRGRFRRPSGGEALPRAQSLVRAKLKLDLSGQWAPDGQDWFENIDAVHVGSIPRSSVGTTPGGAVELGVTTERISLGRVTGLRVTRVDPGSPAGDAGIEPGDVIVQANREPVESQQQLLELYRRAGGEFSLTVRDVRSGRDVLVPVAAAGDRPLVVESGQMRPLGTTTKLAFFRGEPALEVTAVEPGSPASQAGITPGLLILQAGGKSLDSPEALNTAASTSGGRLELTVGDPKNSQTRRLRVDLR
jgi:hypothetical protein